VRYHITKFYIIRLTDVVQSDGRLFLVFEYVDRDLKKLFDTTDGFLPPQSVKVNQHNISHNQIVFYYCLFDVFKSVLVTCSSTPQGNPFLSRTRSHAQRSKASEYLGFQRWEAETC